MLHVIAIITAVAGKRDALLAAFLANVPAVVAEDGCLEYVATIDALDIGALQAPLGPDVFLVVEKWTSPDALRAHASSAHMKAYSAATENLVAHGAVHVLSAA